MFTSFLERWNLTPDGNPVITPTSRLLPVRHGGVPAMLKVATHKEERRGGLLMAWWAGQGAARVFAQEGDALLMERAKGDGQSLAEFSQTGRDDEAIRIICLTVSKLHTAKACHPPELVPLSQWFEALYPAAAAQGGLFNLSARAATELLATRQSDVVLHGDIHHQNILDFGEHGWLAIDPKGLLGERGFDYANLFCNPDETTATAPGRLAQRVTLVSALANMDRKRLLQWIVAWSGLSAAWLLEDDEAPTLPLTVADIAAAELNR